MFANRFEKIASFLALSGMVLLVGGCAATGGGAGGGLPPIAEGKGRLFLETSGVGQVNFYVIDQDTDEEVYSETPRLSASSPRGFDIGGTVVPQYVDLPPGTYTVVVNTDIRDSVEQRDVEILMGQERYVHIPLGRFQLLYYTSGPEGPVRTQMPFLIYDYNMRTVLGRAMTSTEVRYFILPVGSYKVRIENSPTGLDEQRPVQITVGRTQNISISPPATVPTPGEEPEGGQL